MSMQSSELQQLLSFNQWYQAWKTRVENMLKTKCSRPVSGGQSGGRSQTFSEHKYNRTLQNYFIDLANSTTEAQRSEIWSQFTNRLLQVCGSLNAQELEAVIRYSPTIQASSKLDLRTLELSDGTVLGVDTVEIKLPYDAAMRLTSKSTPQDIENLKLLILRYYPLGVGGGFFWSLHPMFYQQLEVRNPIECYASPFNFNTKRWCSVFPSDSVYGSLGRMQDYISNLKTPELLVVNPPYTENQIYHSVSIVLSYIKRVQSSQAIFLLPYWNDNADIQRLLQDPNCQHQILQPSQYSLYDYGIGKAISLSNVSLVLASISNGNPTVPLTWMVQLLVWIRESESRNGTLLQY